MKALQAAVLEQQLAAAAHSCHATQEYARFVAGYRNAIVSSDQTVRAFFRRQSTGETYEAYKSRIAHDIALASLHDLRFCDTAQLVFDLALGRRKPAEPPALVETGYEGCRPLPDKPVAMPRPAVVAAVKAPPTGASAARVAAAAPWDVGRIMVLLHPMDVPVPEPAPLRIARALAVAYPAAMPQPAKVATAPDQRSNDFPVPMPRETELAETGASPGPTMREWHPEITHPIARYAAAQRPHWRNPEQALESMDGLPNAYRPGAQWVGAESDGLPRDRWGRVPPYMYRGRDGRWYVRIGEHARWDD